MANPEEVVNRIIEAIESRELDTAMDFVTEDCFYDNVPIGSMTGKAKMTEFLSGLLKGPGPVEFEVIRQASSGNTVMNERIDRFTTGGGKKIELQVMGVFEVENDLIMFWRDYFDNGMFMKQVKG